MTHKELLLDLAAFLYKEKILFLEVTPQSRYLHNSGFMAPCPDILAFSKSYTNLKSSIYEVKSSRADFLSDIRSEKWRKYLPLCSRFYFAVENAQVAAARDIPLEAGLFVRCASNNWHCVRVARVRNEPEWSLEQVQALLMSGVWSCVEIRNYAERKKLWDNAAQRWKDKKIRREEYAKKRTLSGLRGIK